MSVSHTHRPSVPIRRKSQPRTQIPSSSAGHPVRGREACVRVSQEGVCLEVLPYKQFGPLPPASELLGMDVRQAFPDQLGAVVAREISEGGLQRRVREVTSGTLSLRVEISPTRDGTTWVRLREVHSPAARASGQPGIPRVRPAAGTQPWLRLDDEGRVTDWNAAAARVTGLTADAVVGRPLSGLSIDERWRTRVDQALAMTTDGTDEFQEWLWAESGRRVCLAVAIRRNLGVRWVSLRDVTGRRERESRAAALYAVGRAALDAKSVDDLIGRTLAAMCDALDWEVGLYWEVDADERHLRCRRGVRVGHRVLDGVATEDGSLTLPHDRGLAGRVGAGGRPDSVRGGFDDHPVFGPAGLGQSLRSGFAFPIRGGAGTLGVFEFASRAEETPGAELLRTVAIISNHISQFADRLRAEQALRESDAQKAAILSNALDGIIRVDGHGRIVELNAEAERTFGCEPQTMLGHELSGFAVGAEDRDKLRSELTDLARGDVDAAVTGRRVQVRVKRADGEEFPVDLSISRIPLDGPPYVSICVRDLSEQERLQEALHHSQKMESLGLLASGIAHDFNNFLTVIRGQAERLVKNLTEDDERRKWVKSILKVSERASALTSQLLAFGRREAGKVAIVDLNAVVQSTGGLLSQQLGETVAWKTALSPRVGPARVGEGQVQQILFNLALNARDAMPEGGTLSVGTRNVDLSTAEARRLLLTPGPYVQLWVRDTGKGMDARTQSRVFEPFFTTKKLGDGTGLGLSTVYAIVQQCGGQITVSSRVGEGTTFDIYLPRVTGQTPAAEPSHPALDRALAGLTVLLVEDEDEIREIIRESLEEQGCDVIEAGDGMTALERCARHDGPIHLLLTDMMMPGMNGHQLAERVVRLRPDTPVMFVSGHPEAEVGDNTLIGRRVALLRKPFSSDELVERVVQVVEQPA